MHKRAFSSPTITTSWYEYYSKFAFSFSHTLIENIPSRRQYIVIIIFDYCSTMASNPIFALLWLVLLWFVAWPVAGICAAFWILLQVRPCRQYYRFDDVHARDNTLLSLGLHVQGLPVSTFIVCPRSVIWSVFFICNTHHRNSHCCLSFFLPTCATFDFFIYSHSKLASHRYVPFFVSLCITERPLPSLCCLLT